VTERYCQTCLLKHGHPGIQLDGEDICNLCRMEIPPSMVENHRYSSESYRAFLEAAPDPTAPYDCLFMYSGGKDSTFMLDRFVHAEKRRVLSYTFDIPFQSEHAMRNIRKIQTRIKIEYFIDKADEKIRRLMQHVFNALPTRTPGKYLDEKTPCMLCRDFFILRAIVYATQHRIPFIIFCADPQQIVTIESKIKSIVKGFYNRVGREVAHELFGEELEDILFLDEADLPRIVFPYISMRNNYRPEKIIAYLKDKDLYTSSPLETHCTLFPLLNYYSFKNHDCSFYRLNMASQIRAGERQSASTFGISFNRDGADLVEVEAQYKSVIFDIVRNGPDAEEQRRQLAEVFAKMSFEQGASDYLVEKYMNLREIADDMGIELPRDADADADAAPQALSSRAHKPLGDGRMT
jgi:hypothetical protein